MPGNVGRVYTLQYTFGRSGKLGAIFTGRLQR